MEFNIDVFGEIIDGFLKENNVKMLIEYPEGTLEPEIKDNLELGWVVTFYLLTHAMKTALDGICSYEVVDETKKEDIIDALLEVIKAEVLEEVTE